MDKGNKCKVNAYITVFLLIYLTSSYVVTVTDMIPGTISVLSLLFVTISAIFLNNKKIYINIRSFILLLFIAIVALSTCIISIVPVLLAYFLRNNKKHKLMNLIKVLLISISIILVLLYLMPEFYFNLVFAKLRGLFSETGSNNFSAIVRINAIIYPFYEFIKSPLFGIGYDSFRSMTVEKIYGMPTCTPMNWLAIFGIMGGIPCIYYYLQNVLRFRCDLLSKIFLGTSLLLIIMSEDYLRIALVYVMIFYGSCSQTSKVAPNSNIISRSTAL